MFSCPAAARHGGRVGAPNPVPRLKNGVRNPVVTGTADALCTAGESPRCKTICPTSRLGNILDGCTFADNFSIYT